MRSVLTDVELVAGIASQQINPWPEEDFPMGAAPAVVDRLDAEAQRRTDGAHVLVHDTLDDGRLARIVQAAARRVRTI